MGIRQRRTGSEVVQERALATRHKILMSAIEMYSVKGYCKTTVDEIAGKAGMSVGIAYRYFKNKKELLLAALEFMFSHIEVITGTDPQDIVNGNLSASLAVFEKIHMEYRSLHEELEGLRHTDEDVRKLYDGFYHAAVKKIYDGLSDEIKRRPGSLIDLYMAIGVMENYCHIYMHGSLTGEQIKLMREKTISLVSELMVR